MYIRLFLSLCGALAAAAEGASPAEALLPDFGGSPVANEFGTGELNASAVGEPSFEGVYGMGSSGRKHGIARPLAVLAMIVTSLAAAFLLVQCFKAMGQGHTQARRLGGAENSDSCGSRGEDDQQESGEQETGEAGEQTEEEKDTGEDAQQKEEGADADVEGDAQQRGEEDDAGDVPEGTLSDAELHQKLQDEISAALASMGELEKKLEDIRTEKQQREVELEMIKGLVVTLEKQEQLLKGKLQTSAAELENLRLQKIEVESKLTEETSGEGAAGEGEEAGPSQSEDVPEKETSPSSGPSEPEPASAPTPSPAPRPAAAARRKAHKDEKTDTAKEKTVSDTPASAPSEPSEPAAPSPAPRQTPPRKASKEQAEEAPKEKKSRSGKKKSEGESSGEKPRKSKEKGSGKDKDEKKGSGKDKDEKKGSRKDKDEKKGSDKDKDEKKKPLPSHEDSPTGVSVLRRAARYERRARSAQKPRPLDGVAPRSRSPSIDKLARRFEGRSSSPELGAEGSLAASAGRRKSKKEKREEEKKQRLAALAEEIRAQRQDMDLPDDRKVQAQRRSEKKTYEELKKEIQQQRAQAEPPEGKPTDEDIRREKDKEFEQRLREVRAAREQQEQEEESSSSSDEE